MNPEPHIKSFLDAERQSTIALLSEFVAIPTVNPPGLAYREFVDVVSRLLTSWKIEHRIVTVPNGDRPRYSLMAFLGGGEPGLHFHGHYDVVSAESEDQFRPVERNGRVYGRGTADMKGGIVAMLFAMRAIAQAGVKLSKALTLM